MSYIKLISLLLPFFLIKICDSGAVGPLSGPACIYHLSNEVDYRESTTGDMILSNGTVVCGDPQDFCFSFWQVNNPDGDADVVNSSANQANIKWLARGCFKNVDTCNEKKCHAKRKSRPGMYFCCCRGNLCNQESNIEYLQDSPVIMHPETSNDKEKLKIMLVLKAAIVVFFGLVIMIIVFYLKQRQPRKTASPYPCEKTVPSSPCIDLNNIKFMDNIGNGRYGTVYRAFLNDEEVAVKLVSTHNKSVFVEEKYIYSLPLMEHPNLLSFLGGGEMNGPGGIPSLGLVLSYCPKGRLDKFLSNNTVDFSAFCRIIVTLTRGLSHLHSEIRKGELVKPCVAHRDFNTRNILLKEDMTCVVCDLGFAIHTQGAKFYVNGEERNAEMESLTDVGTHRYMAPEVLEGAVNLRDCETSLKQIDIYALGIIMWEIASRCHDLYQGMETPRYALPFSAELGDPDKASFGHMQVLVARNKARPLFPSVWKDSNPAIRQLKETIEDCWDNDAEARLSAMCVERRLLELKVLWRRYKASLAKAGASPNPDGSNGVLNQVRSTEEGKTGFIISNKLTLPKERSSFPPSRRDTASSENTVATIVANSPLDLGVPFVKNRFVESLIPLANAVQPHQGRNPCAQRNTTRETTEPCISGNLLDGSDQLHNDLRNTAIMQMLESQHAIDPRLLKTEHLVPLLNGFMPESLGNERVVAPSNTDRHSNLPLQCSHPPLPAIPYLQNEVRGFDAKQQNCSRQSDIRRGSNNIWQSFKNTWETRLGSMLTRKRQQHTDEEQREILVTPTSSSVSEPPTPLFPLQVNEAPLNTKVLLTNGGPHTIVFSGESSNNQGTSNHNRHLDTEIGIAKLEYQSRLTPVVRSRQGSRDSGMNSSNNSSLDRSKRPSTLSLQGVVLRHPRNRVKTPCNKPIQSRLSLYGESDEETSQVSLSRSLPYSMNSDVTEAETAACSEVRRAVDGSIDSASESTSDWSIERVGMQEHNGIVQHTVAANV